MVMVDGFAWNGQTYDSLSKVAFAITGTKWNGPVVVQMPTHVSKIASHRFRTVVAASEQLRSLCIEYNEVLLSQARVIAACNALHSVEGLAFLAPNLIKAAVEGRLPRGI